MIHELIFSKDDRIAVIAPHPDDECLGASAPLLLVPDQTDVFVLTDGSHGNRERPFEEEAEVRKKQFEAIKKADPYYNLNLTLDVSDYRLSYPPRN